MIEFETAQRILVSHLATVEREMNLFGSALPNAKDCPYTHLVVSHVTEERTADEGLAPASFRHRR
jgi:hypothetical protein